MTSPDPILLRIHKLLALADGARGSTEAEAAAAAAKVQQMLQEHGLSLAQVEAASISPTSVAREKATVARHGAFYAYQIDLMKIIATSQFCLHRVSTVKVGKLHAKRHQLVGRELNVRVTNQVYDYLLEAMKRAAASAGYTTDKGLTRDYHAFFTGCSSRLQARLQAKHEAALRAADAAKRAAPPSSNALVLSDVLGSEADLNNDFLNNYPAGTTAARRRAAEEERAKQRIEKDRLVAQGVPDTEAWYLAFGYTPADAKVAATSWNRSTGRSRRGRSRSGWTAGDQARAAMTGSAAYAQGTEAGNAIGLDPQATYNPARQITK